MSLGSVHFLVESTHVTKFHFKIHLLADRLWEGQNMQAQILN